MYKSVKDIVGELTQKTVCSPQGAGRSTRSVGPRGGSDPAGVGSRRVVGRGCVSHRVQRVLVKTDEPNHEKTCSTAPKLVDVWFEGYFYT